MDTLPKILTATENVVAYCSKQAAAGKPINPNAFKDLGRIASDLRKQANQSDNSAFYGLGAPKLVRPEDGFANDGASPAGLGEMNKAAELTFDTYESNLKVAEDVLAKSKATLATINKLAAAGKKFNHTAARADVAKVANRVASLCEKTALTEEWVAADLSKLAAEATRLYKLFHPKS
jgi:hypothetical protein